jgi:hypothetical protein
MCGPGMVQDLRRGHQHEPLPRVGSVHKTAEPNQVVSTRIGGASCFVQVGQGPAEPTTPSVRD